MGEQKDWQQALRRQVLNALDEKLPERLLVLNDTTWVGGTYMLALGLLQEAFPQTQARMIAADLLEWRHELFELWLADKKPGWDQIEPNAVSRLGLFPAELVMKYIWQHDGKIRRGQAGALVLEPIYENLPLSPHRTPRRREIRWVLDVIKDVLASGFIVYIHSNWPDIRGTVAACWLVERGMGGVPAFQTLEHLLSEPSEGW